VVTNLLNNAARYTPDGGRVTLTAVAVHDEAVITVSDTGIGLQPADLDRVFEMFTQVGEPGKGGLGIGLALVKGLVELHGGRVEARSNGPGQGAELRIRLKRADAPPPSTPDVADRERPLHRLRILVVDDNADSAEMMKLYLETQGHEVGIAYNGESALTLLAEFGPGVGLFDIGLPGMSGYELARRARAQSAGGGLFLIALTGWGQEEDRQRAREAGFDAHLTKPADPAEIDRLIAQAVSRRAGWRRANGQGLTGP
jgi:CheY-like chemotaxis protein